MGDPSLFPVVELLEFELEEASATEDFPVARAVRMDCRDPSPLLTMSKTAFKIFAALSASSGESTFRKDCAICQTALSAFFLSSGFVIFELISSRISRSWRAMSRPSLHRH